VTTLKPSSERRMAASSSSITSTARFGSSKGPNSSMMAREYDETDAKTDDKTDDETDVKRE
jgi:hypothetical protein